MLQIGVVVLSPSTERTNHYIFLDPKAMESMWIIGDTFVASSYQRFLKMETSQTRFYIRDNYDVFAFFNNNHFDTNILSRIRNVLVTALNQHEKLPRFLCVIIDNDILRFINHNKHGINLELGTYLEWLLAEFDRILNIHVEQLPCKCRIADQNFPHVLWFGLPINMGCRDNELRIVFNKSLEQVIPKFKEVCHN